MNRQPIMSQTQLWSLSDDLCTVRMSLPPLTLASFERPVELHFDFGADVIDQILQRLTELRLQMLPAPERQ
jgi:hypothetical protein